MFTDEHALDYSSPPLWDDYDDEVFDLETVNDNTYDDPFDFKEEKIKDSKILIDELDPPRSSDFLPFPECDSVFYEDFSEVDALSSTNNEEKDVPVTRASNPQLYYGNPISKSYQLIPVDIGSKWADRKLKLFQTSDAAEVVITFSEEKLFCHFGYAPIALISDRDLTAAGKKRMFQLHELDELRHQDYENSRSNKERTKFWQDRKIKNEKGIQARKQGLTLSLKIQI
ncbi:hypothetical protein Tco_0915794 [Tanacetum coccineum]